MRILNQIEIRSVAGGDDAPPEEMGTITVTASQSAFAAQAQSCSNDMLTGGGFGAAIGAAAGPLGALTGGLVGGGLVGANDPNCQPPSGTAPPPPTSP